MDTEIRTVTQQLPCPFLLFWINSNTFSFSSQVLRLFLQSILASEDFFVDSISYQNEVSNNKSERLGGFICN